MLKSNLITLESIRTIKKDSSRAGLAKMIVKAVQNLYLKVKLVLGMLGHNKPMKKDYLIQVMTRFHLRGRNFVNSFCFRTKVRAHQ